MAELLETHLLCLKAKLSDLRKSYDDEERPVAVDMQIQAIEHQLRTLIEADGSPGGGNWIN